MLRCTLPQLILVPVNEKLLLQLLVERIRASSRETDSEPGVGGGNYVDWVGYSRQGGPTRRFLEHATGWFLQ
jgi:hypothetical protein